MSPLVIFVAAEVYAEMNQRFGPPEREAMREATIAFAKRMGAPDKLAAALGARLPEKFMDAFGSALWGKPTEPMACHEQPEPGYGGLKPECVAWVRRPHEARLARREGTRQELEAQFLPRKSSFDIFVNCWKKVIWVSLSEEPIRLEPRVQRMLVLFMLHRGEPIHPSQMVRWAWPAGSPVIGANQKKLRSNLKVAVSDLRTKVEGVRSLEIPELRGDGTYYCQGEFTFCILLPGWMEEKLASLGLLPRF